MLQFMPGKKSDSVKRSRKFRSLLPLDDNVPERSSGIELIPAGKTGDKLLVPRLGRRSVVVVWTKNSSEWVLEEAKESQFQGNPDSGPARQCPATVWIR